MASAEVVQTAFGPVTLSNQPVQTARPVVTLDEFYLETAFARRMREVLEEARENRSWHVVTALTGAGKSTELEDLADQHPVERRHSGETVAPVITGSPLTNGRSSLAGLQRSLIDNFGTVPRGTFEDRRAWLVREMVRCGTQIVITDDGHGHLAPDLLYLKQLTDEVAKLAKSRVGLVIVCEGLQGSMPLQEIVNRQTSQWRQFRKRMSTSTRPWCHIASLNAEEVKLVLAGYEQGVLKPRFPELRLTKWSSRIHKHLAHPFFDTDPGERVTMQNVRNVVDGIIRRLAARRLSNIPGEALIDEVVAAMLASSETKVLVRDPGRIGILDGNDGLVAKVKVIE